MHKPNKARLYEYIIKVVLTIIQWSGVKLKFELVTCPEEVWGNTLSGVNCSFLNKDNSVIVCLISYESILIPSILIPGVYDISMKGEMHSADVRIIKYSNMNNDGVIDDFNHCVTIEATKDENSFRTGDSFMGWSVSEDIISELNSVNFITEVYTEVISLVVNKNDNDMQLTGVYKKYINDDDE